MGKIVPYRARTRERVTAKPGTRDGAAVEALPGAAVDYLAVGRRIVTAGCGHRARPFVEELQRQHFEQDVTLRRRVLRRQARATRSASLADDTLTDMGKMLRDHATAPGRLDQAVADVEQEHRRVAEQVEQLWLEAFVAPLVAAPDDGPPPDAAAPDRTGATVIDAAVAGPVRADMLAADYGLPVRRRAPPPPLTPLRAARGRVETQEERENRLDCEKAARSRAKLKKEVHEGLAQQQTGGVVRCAIGAPDDPCFRHPNPADLDLDHIEGGGNRERGKGDTWKPYRIVRDLLRAGQRVTRYRLACRRHNRCRRDS